VPSGHVSHVERYARVILSPSYDPMKSSGGIMKKSLMPCETETVAHSRGASWPSSSTEYHFEPPCSSVSHIADWS